MFYRSSLNCVNSEFLAAALEAKGNIDNRRLAEAFHELDEDRSGYITRVSEESVNFGPAVHHTNDGVFSCPQKDLKTILPSTVTDEEIDKMIADVDRPDSDGRRDGRISFDEFRCAFSNESSRKISRLYD